MLQNIVSFLQGHGLGVILIAFSILSIVLTAFAGILQALGKNVPGWIGTVLDYIGKAVHFLNGNVVAAVKPSDVK